MTISRECLYKVLLAHIMELYASFQKRQSLRYTVTEKTLVFFFFFLVYFWLRWVFVAA